MLYTNQYIQTVLDCAASKQAAATYDAYIASSFGMRRKQSLYDSRILHILHWALSKWDNRSGAVNTMTSAQLSDLIGLILKFPYPCDLESTISISSIVSNKPPIVDAGIDKTVNVLSTNLVGTATDLDGTITYIQWSVLDQPSGGNAAFGTGNQLNTSVTVQIPGTYVFKLLVKDSNGTSAFDTVVVTVATVVLDTILFGVNSTPDIPVGFGTYESISVNGALDITTDWTSLYAAGYKYVWILIPRKNANYRKMAYYLRASGFTGTIGNPGDLWDAPVNVTIAGVDYYQYISNWETRLTGKVDLKLT